MLRITTDQSTGLRRPTGNNKHQNSGVIQVNTVSISVPDLFGFFFILHAFGLAQTVVQDHVICDATGILELTRFVRIVCWNNGRLYFILMLLSNFELKEERENYLNCAEQGKMKSFQVD